jgi:hypothetical protein
VENIKNLLKKKKLLIVCHDTGGANIIKNFIDHYTIKAKYYLKGPALNIFKEKKQQHNFINNIKKSDIVITGTGWQTDLEYKAIKYAKKFNKICLTFIDHWANYKKRFVRSKRLVLPNIIFVFDTISQLKIKKIFKNKVKVLKIKNFYFCNFKKRAKKFKVCSKNILYLSSNYDAVLNKKNIDSMLLKNFLQKIIKLKKYNNFNIDIKPHPTESSTKYYNFKKNNKKIKNIIKIKNLENIILKYKIVAGTETTGLALAKLCKLEVINNICKVGLKKSLPSKYITTVI